MITDPKPKQYCYIFGASGDIGLAAAKRLRAAGLKLVLFANQHADRLRAESLLKNELIIELDLLNSDEITATLSDLISLYPARQLLYAAGISHYALFQNSPLEIQDQIFQINYRAYAQILHHLIPVFLQQGGGDCLAIASIQAEDPASMEAVYAASKAAMVALTRSLAAELGPSKIRFNTIAPGWIDGEMNAHFSEEEKKAFLEDVALMRSGKPEEVAELCHFLLSDAAAYITGQCFRIDGGI
ncbi:MAG: SDR family oxidoreductase [Eubacteriales bacterium]|nr:SDR family oxidoreductase [Eubacteriales bacterium]